MSYQCKVTERASQPTLTIRTRTAARNLGETLGEAYGTIMQYMGELGEHPVGPPYTAYYNEDMQDLDVEVGFPVARELPGKGNVQAGEIPGGKVATCLHVGAYSDIGPAYEALSQWMQENGYEPAGAAYEFYLNDPQETPSEELMTQILFPLKG
mgnify:CR=1 FL=1